MRVYPSNQLRSGYKIIFSNKPHLIESSEFVKPGKGQAFVRVKLRNFLTKQLIEKTFKSTELLPAADIIEYKMSYLYNDGLFWYFINNIFEQLSIEKKIIGANVKWLLAQDLCDIVLWNKQPISITPKNFVELKVIDTEVNLKGDTLHANSTKLATLITGAVIKVPLFVQIGSLVKVDTRSGEYVCRL